MADFTVLHLSDVHFGMNDDWAEVPLVTKKLVEAVHGAGIAPDLCIFSGDLAQAGNSEQLQKGMGWLEEVLGPFGCPLAIVPGNHDLVRDEEQQKTLSDAYHDEEAFLRWRGELRSQQRFQGFLDHCSSSQKGSSLNCLFDWSRNLLFAKRREELNGLPVNLIGLNTAAASLGKKDKSRLVAEVAELNRFLAELDSGQELILAIGHHPFAWLAKWNREAVNAALAAQNNGAHAWFCGHLHSPRADSFNTSRGQSLVTLAAGAAYQPTQKWSQHFAFYDFDLAEKIIQPSVYQYNKEARCWDLRGDLSKPLPGLLPRRFSTSSRTDSAPSAVRPSTLDPVIVSRIRDAFSERESQELLPLLLKVASRVVIVPDDADLATLLCAPRVDLAIGWLQLISEEYLKQLRHKGGDVKLFKKNAEEALGWLVLRAVDPTWLASHGGALQSPKAKVEVSIHRPACVEVAVSGAEERGAAFHPARDGGFTQGRSVIQMGGEPGIDPFSSVDQVLGAVWQQVIRRPIPTHFGREERDELRDALETDSQINRHYHLCVDLGNRKTPLTESDLDALQEEFGELKMILIRANGNAALVLDETRLDRSIENFFRYVV